MFGDLVALVLVMFLMEKVILMVAVMSMVMVMSMVTVMSMVMVMVMSMVTVTVIVIPVQEATFASGGKNKAVRKLRMSGSRLQPTQNHHQLDGPLYGSFVLFFKVRETIYILGLGLPGLRPPTEGEEPLPPLLKVFNSPASPISPSSSPS